MNRAKFVENFAKRLNLLLQKEGYSSHRSKSGTDISQLAKVADVSYQMARKYSLGMALPDYHIIPKIAHWLNVSPNWLLFGENDDISPSTKSPTLIEIEHELLRHILLKCSVLFSKTDPSNTEKILNYISSVIYDVSHITADNQTIIKIIDMMVSSAVELNHSENRKRA